MEDQPINTITFRNKVIKSCSLNSLNSTEECEDISVANMTNQSLPNLTDCNSDPYATELKEQIDRLNSRLESANAEIDNLCSENNSLKRRLANCEKKILLYKKIGIDDLNIIRSPAQSTSSPFKFFSPQYRPINRGVKTKAIRNFSTNLFSQLDDTTFDNNSATTNPASPPGTPPPSLTMIPSSLTPPTVTPISKPTGLRKKQDTQDSAECNTDKQPVATMHVASSKLMSSAACLGAETVDSAEDKLLDVDQPKNKVLLLADEYGRGMRNILESFIGKDFVVTAVLKPNAPLDQILRSCGTLCKDFTKSDYIVILAGSNDTNPIKFQSFLYYYLNLFENTNVILGEICRSKHLNESKLNNCLKVISSQFINVKLLDLIFFEKHNDKYCRFDKLNTCRSIVRTILCLNYKYKCSLVASNSVIPSDDKGTKIHKKGTLPYYFPIIKKIICSNSNVKSGETSYVKQIAQTDKLQNQAHRTSKNNRTNNTDFFRN